MVTFVMVGLAMIVAFQQQQTVANAMPIVNSYLNPWEVPFRHSVGLLRDPMPWEDGYFDPVYHAWPESRQQQMGDKQSIKLASEETVSGGPTSGNGNSDSASKSTDN